MLVGIRDLELDDIRKREGFVQCLQQIAPVDLSQKALKWLYHDRQHSGMRTLVAIIADFIVGTATLAIEQKFIHNGGKVGKIEDVAVHPDYHGLGIGRLLIERILELAKEANCYKAILTCADHNIKFYKILGFREHENSMRIDL